ncbi:hypothetical protein [Halospeciosus flavus]|uniref:Uncharacterized protein n=3 Tax=Halospeciosus flavus TaxID=3032283 RepID=A0ABD5Z9N2_9EURY|nr:hypothetical protein [Halospeciosus flavus]
MNDTDEPAIARTDAVTVERTVERKDRGVTAEYVLTTATESPVRARIEQSFTGDPIDEIGFHPDHSPTEWDADDSGVAFETVVRPDEPTTAVLGLVTEDVHDGLLDGEPRVTRVESVTDPSSESAEPTETSGRDAGADAGVEGAGDVPASGKDSLLADVKRIVLGSSTPAESPEPPAASNVVADRGEIESGGEGVDEREETVTPESVGIEPATTDESQDSDEPAAPVDVVERVVDAETDETTEAAIEPATEAPDPADESVVTADAEPADEGGDDASSSLVERLVAELETGETDEAQREALREALGVAESPAESTGESVAVRLRHLQTRMEDFAAYADVLEEVIDQYGTDFLAETETRLDDVDDELDTVRTAADDARDARAALREDVAALRDEVADVGDETAAVREDIDDIRGELDALGESHETRVRRLEDDVDMLAGDARQARADLREDVADLRREVRDLTQMREALSTAFGSGGPTEELWGFSRRRANRRTCATSTRPFSTTTSTSTRTTPAVSRP